MNRYASVGLNDEAEFLDAEYTLYIGPELFGHEDEFLAACATFKEMMDRKGSRVHQFKKVRSSPSVQSMN